MKNFIFTLLFFLELLPCKAQSYTAEQSNDTLVIAYQAAYDNIKMQYILNGSFKDCVFESENAYFKGLLNKQDFYAYIDDLVSLCNSWRLYNPLTSYRYPDSNSFHKNLSIFTVLKDTIRIQISDDQQAYHLPYSYDFSDFWGKEKWSNMFVSKLLVTQKGNCHSLPYLYKILADETGAICWLGLAPNHIYVKNRSKKTGWYNTELTSGTFPIDAWITASGYIPLQAIQNGIYMDTLSNQQAIALTILDLAKGYEFQTRNYYDGFILKCCDFVLQYHSVNTQAILLKAETLKRIYERQVETKDSNASQTYKEMESLYVTLFNLGYREMPERMYTQWLESVMQEKEKYVNPKLKESLPAKKAF